MDNTNIDVKNNLIDYLKELHLPNVRNYYEEGARLAQKDSLNYEMFLLDVMQKECEARRNNRKERLLKDSKIPYEKRLENYDLKRIGNKNIQKVRTLLDGSFLNRNENILVFGNPGSGKTHLLCAIGKELIEKGYKILFFNSSLLIQELLKAKQELRLSKYLDKLLRYDCLILDDIGYIQQSQDEMEVLFTLFAESYEKGSIMISSNLPFSKWDNIFRNPMTAAAAIDRLVHHSIIIELNINSYRIEQANIENNKKND